MLILTRNVGRSLVIGDGEVIITVCEIRGNQVRLGIDAPKNVSVHRKEIFERIKNNEKQELLNKDVSKIEDKNQENTVESEEIMRLGRL